MSQANDAHLAMAAPATALPFDSRTAIGCGKGEEDCELDLGVIHDFAVRVAIQAGVLVRRRARQLSRQSHAADHLTTRPAASTSNVQLKSSEVDIVTELDVQVEDLIRAEIEHSWPRHRIVAEESYGKNAGVKARWEREQGPTWHVDPLDGTMNFTHSLQLHCISIGFSCSHRAGEVLFNDDALVGVIYAPMLGPKGTLWSGARGRGSYLSYPANLPKGDNGPHVNHECTLAQLEHSTSEEERDEECCSTTQRLPLLANPLPLNAPSGILFASEWGKDRRSRQDENGNKGNLANKTDTFIKLAANDAFIDPDGDQVQPSPHVHGFRSLGSSAPDLAFVAQGSVDVLWEGGCWEWDVCAGIAILLESGGLVTDSNPPNSASSVLWKQNSVLPRADLGARRFLAIRACTMSVNESPQEAQARVVRQIWKRTSGLNYRRDGVLYAVEADSLSLQIKSTSSVRSWTDPLRERKRLTREEAEALRIEGPTTSTQDDQEDDSFGGRLLDEGKDQWSHNAWDHVEPPASYLALIEDKLRVQEETKLTNEQAANFHQTPADFWDTFYRHHENRFFKDRKWLHLEFPELIKASLANAPPTRILEVGCGAGNTVFPLLAINKNPDLEIFACDYSAEAVNVVKNNHLYEYPPCGQCSAKVWDLTSTTSEGEPSGPEGITPHSLDIIVLIFVLSALHPEEWKRAVNNVKHLLRKDGVVLVRDYGRHDLPQLRFGKGRMLADNFYVRGDGTRVYFFQAEEFLSLFNATPPSFSTNVSSNGEGLPLKRHDFETLQLAVDRRMLLNRKEKKQMFRNWLQAKFRILS